LPAYLLCIEFAEQERCPRRDLKWRAAGSWCADAGDESPMLIAETGADDQSGAVLRA